MEDLIEEEQCVYTLTNGGYIKRTSTSSREKRFIRFSLALS